jgi:uncharacterized membrane-anchored protein
MRKSWAFAGLAMGQILVLALWAGAHEWTLRTGPTVTLETEPVDPRDIIRGDFIILGYPIQRVPFDRFEPPLITLPADGTRIYVELRPEGGFHRLARASLKPLAPAPGNLLIRGRASRIWPAAGPGNVVRVVYGIEKFFVPEGRGNPRGKIVATVALASNGHPYLKFLTVDGRAFP